jgi:hypothetical protein
LIVQNNAPTIGNLLNRSSLNKPPVFSTRGADHPEHFPKQARREPRPRGRNRSHHYIAASGMTEAGNAAANLTSVLRTGYLPTAPPTCRPFNDWMTPPISGAHSKQRIPEGGTLAK